MTNQIHVLRNETGGWDIKRDSPGKVTLHAVTKEDAVERAREISTKQGMELVVHNEDGTTSKMDSSGLGRNPAKE